MANWYVWSGATGTGTGADWTNAYVRLRLATAAKAAGDVFFVAHDHAETEAAAMTITFAGTDVSPNRVYCVNRAGSVPPVSADLRTTATISTTGASNISIGGSFAEIYGITFSAGDAANSATIQVASSSNQLARLVSCALKLNNTNTASRISFPFNACLGLMENTTLLFGSVSQQLTAVGQLVWRNTPNALAGATFPTTLMTYGSPRGTFFLEGVDLSALTSGKTLVTSPTTSTRSTTTFKDCKLGAAVTIASNSAAASGPETILIRCDSGDTNYRTEKYSFSGTQTTETTIVRTGGATDGTTPIAWKIVTTANSEWEFPFECLPISIWNETVGSAVTVTIQGIWGTGSVPLNSDIWIDVEYLGTSGFPLAVKATSGKADGLAAGANIPAGSGTWGGSTTKFAMAATFTPQEKGPITIYVRAAKISSTFYVDPKPVVT